MKKIILTTLIAICCSIMLGQTQAVHFSGTNSSIDVGNSFGNGLRTIECWFRPSVNISSSITDPAYSLVVRNDAQFNEFGLYIIGSDWTVNKGKLAFYVRYNGGINQIHSNLDTWNANTWYHVSGTIDPVDGMKLYVDGVAQTETKPSFKNATTNQTQVTKIGTWGDANLRYFKGDIDEVRFWNRALTSSEVNSKKCCLLNPANETGLVGYWHFEEGTGTTTNEVINNSNNALTNVSWVSSNNCISNLTTWYLDQDNDNYASQTTLSCQSPGTGWTTVSMPVIDCNDQNAAIYPSQLENYFNSIDDNCDAIIQYQLSANSNSGGSISPNGNMIVNQGVNQYYTITPQPGYYISDVIVDGASLGAITSYGFNNINASHNITVMFAQILPTISIVSDDSDNSICNGTSITFNATVTNAGSSPVYQWQVNGNNVGSNQSSYTTTNLQNNDVITCEVNPGVNQAASNAITISIAESPIVNVTKNAWNGTCIGNSIWLCANSGQSSTATYLWSNGTTTDCFNANNAGIYTCTVTNSIGCQASGTVEVIYDPLPDQTINYPNQISLCANKSDSVYVINPSQNQTYQWFTYDVTGTAHIISGETTTKLKIGNGSNINSLGNTTLIVYITNTVTNCYSSNWINVFINPQPNVIITSSNGTSLCNGNNTTLTANGTSSYIWNNGATTNNLNITATTSTNYAVTGTDNNGCSATANISINIANNCPSINSTYCNRTITNFSSQGIVANVLPGATNYEFRFEEVNSNGTIIYTAYGTSTTNIISLVNVTNPGLLHYNSHYLTSVRVSTDNGSSWTAFGTKCNLYTLQPPNTPNNGYCGIHRNNLLSIYSVNPMGLATQYKIRYKITGSSNYLYYTFPAGQNSVVLQNIPGITYNTTYEVQISSLVPYSYNYQTSTTEYDWSPYGNMCFFYMDHPANNPNNGYCGIHRNNLSNIYSVNTMGMARQYKLRLRINGDNDPNHYIVHTLPLGATGVTLSNIPGLTYNTVYTVEISSDVPYAYDATTGTYSYNWSPYGTPCLFYIDHPANNPNNGYCGIHRNNLNNIYSVNTMGMARQYKLRLRVNGDNDPNHYIEHTLPLGATAVTLSNISGLTYNTVYNVEISSDVPYSYDYLTATTSYSWSPYGTPCLLYIDEPANNPSNGYCGIQRNLNGQYCASSVGRATQYKFRLMVNGDPTNTYLYSIPFNYIGIGNLCFVLNATNIPGLQNNTHYKIEISTFVPYLYDVTNQVYTNSTWSPYGNICDLYIGNPPAGSRMAQEESLLNLDDAKLEPINISVFPNPAKNNVNIILPEDGKANITIYDLQGKIANEVVTEESLTNFSLDNMAEGIYIIHVIQNGKTYKEKIIKN